MKTKAEAAFYERTQAALCEVDYGRFEELDRKIKEAMAALPDSYREAFVMHRFKELSYKEIAEVLDVSPQTVAYRIQQALKLLRVSLKAEKYLFLSFPCFFLQILQPLRKRPSIKKSG